MGALFFVTQKLRKTSFYKAKVGADADLVDGFGEMIFGDVGINFCGLILGMTEQLLQRAQATFSLDKQHGKRMAQIVKAQTSKTGFD